MFLVEICTQSGISHTYGQSINPSNPDTNRARQECPDYGGALMPGGGKVQKHDSWGGRCPDYRCCHN